MGRTGSSPLARGLRRGRAGPDGPRRIIPARAGFTPAPSKPSTRSADHPRSRGVYHRRKLEKAKIRGSSPLARGLRVVKVGTVGYRGIIPARAGFTDCGRGVLLHLSDHPRSRGVYCAPRPRPRSCARCAPGSSPLARGLRDEIGPLLDGGRIIPARAGFTPGSTRMSGSWLDHPRSRGVYLMLAVQVVVAWWIIPARAGFTISLPLSAWIRWDHPRSRGVYVETDPFHYRVIGSSPLARGLRGYGRERLVVEGIIPARAGFTTGPAASGLSAEDHPRSRGVYTPPRPTDPSEAGSSPLARGLLGAPRI